MLKTNLQIINQLKQFLENYFEQKEFYTKNAKNFIRKSIAKKYLKNCTMKDGE